ncbi:hypothetical protein GGR51DRAFT_500601 [Nemania sp. FL0031]|nr:hypothetical protein GGR51DRAFT_500601 [Nemania sp. FL0031]
MYHSLNHAIQSKDPRSESTLLRASQNGESIVVWSLLAAGHVNPDCKDQFGRTPLSWAAGNGHQAIVKGLLGFSSVDPDSKDTFGRTPLSHAASGGYEAIVRLLLATDIVDTDARDTLNQTPLSYAAKYGHDEVVDLLLAVDGVDPNFKDALERTPLSYAAGRGYNAVVEVLLAVDGIDPNSKDALKRTPLSHAASGGHDAIVKTLLALNSVDPDSKDILDRTPLSYAAGLGHYGVAKLLLAVDKVDPNSKDTINGRTPLLWAVAQGHESVVGLFLETIPSANIHGSVILETALANGRRNIIVYCLVASYFDYVAQGDFSWLRDLRDEGLEAKDIALLLFELGETSPWVAVGKLDTIVLKGDVDLNLHQPSCAHNKRPTGTREDSPFDPAKLHLERDSMQKRIASFCGIAGVLPPRIPGEESKEVSFEGTKASIIYNYKSQLDNPGSWESRENPFFQLHQTMQRLAKAARMLQQTGFCCNRFTILIASEENTDVSGKTSVVRMNTIPFNMFTEISNELEALIDELVENGITKSGISKPAYTSNSIIERSFPVPSPPQTIIDQLHWCSLTVQVLCLGMVLYSQAHTGKLHPIFLANPLTEVTLQGSARDQPYIIAERQKLACMGDMIGDEVFVFRMSSSSLATPVNPSQKYHLFATCEEIVDSWGPGYLITESSNSYGEKLYGLGIRGGIIRPDQKSTVEGSLFHWGAESSNASFSSKTFNYWEKILIGTATVNDAPPLRPSKSREKPAIDIIDADPLNSRQSYKKQASGAFSIDPHPNAGESRGVRSGLAPISTNTICPLDSAKSRQMSGPYLSSLGTAPSYWKFTETQLMFQAGNYVQLQVGGTMTKQSGIPLKRVILDRWAREGNLSLFEEPWGLQVSLCTGIARRVPLRALIEEPLFRYIDTLNIDGWEALKIKAEHAIQSNDGFLKWTRKLNEDERRCMQTVFDKILGLLKDTGFDASEENLSVLWPHDSDARFCVKIRPEHQPWSRMLKDSEWCAVFAVTTSLCLETQEHKCRKTVAATWCGGKMLSTVVCPNLSGKAPLNFATAPTKAAKAKWKLENKERYWVEKCGGEVVLVVHKLPSSVTALEVKRNRLPGPVASKLWGDRLLKERPDTAFQEAEEVFILHSFP